MRAVFLDRDGTVNAGVPKYKHVDSEQKVEILPNAIEALTLLAKLDYGVFFVTNQVGLAEGLMTWSEFETVNNKVLELIAPSGIKVIKTYVCPHAEAGNCECRKPKPKLLFDAAREYDIDLKISWMIGDRVSDFMAGLNAGTKAILIKTGIPGVESREATFTAPTLLEAVQYIARL